MILEIALGIVLGYILLMVLANVSHVVGMFVGVLLEMWGPALTVQALAVCGR
jgi:hypothetical protein